MPALPTEKEFGSLLYFSSSGAVQSGAREAYGAALATIATLRAENARLRDCIIDLRGKVDAWAHHANESAKEVGQNAQLRADLDNAKIARLTAEVERLMGEKTRSGHYARGRAEERQAVVDWLHDDMTTSRGVSHQISADDLAEEIGAGEHVKGTTTASTITLQAENARLRAALDSVRMICTHDTSQDTREDLVDILLLIESALNREET